MRLQLSEQSLPLLVARVSAKPRRKLDHTGQAAAHSFRRQHSTEHALQTEQ